jgi:predicted permease
MLNDLQYGLRILAKSPGFTAVVVITLALGIGANTAIFTLINSILLKGLPVEKPEQLVLFSDDASQGNITGDQTGKWRYFSYPLYVYFREHNQVFQDICAFRKGEESLNVQVEGPGRTQVPQRSRGKLVSGNYFSVLGVNAMLGRALEPEDERAGAPPVAVISYGYWQRAFGSDPFAVGKVVELNDTAFTVVGVTPPQFFGETVEVPPDFWLPLSLQAQVTRRESFLNSPEFYWLNLMARLQPGVSRTGAQTAVNLQLRQLLSELAGSSPSEDRRRKIQQSSIELAPGGRGISLLRLRYSEPLHMLMAAVALVLLISCANVASLLLSRSAARQKEISVRLALGASRGRLVRQLLTEGLTLAALGGTLGMCISAGGVRILVVMFTGGPNGSLNLDADARVLDFALAVSLLTAVLFSLAPALRATGVEWVPALKGTRASGVQASPGLGVAKALVVFQVALSLLLLTGAGLLLQTLKRLHRQDLGFNPQDVLLVGIDPRLAGYTPERLPGLYRELQERVNALPGVRSASLAAYSPMSGTSHTGSIAIQGYTPRPGQNMDTQLNRVGPRYFETLELPLLSGRGINHQDTESSPKVAVVNATFAHYFFPGQNPIGRRFGFGSPADLEIVGVVKEAKYNDLRESAPRMAYFPILQMKGEGLYVGELDVRAAGDPRSIAADVRRAIHEMDKNLTVTATTTLNEQIASSLNQERAMAELSSFFGLLALALACVGLYGLMAYSVARRTNEIGIRMAVGAKPRDVLRLVLREVLTLVIAGVAIGLPAALAATRLMSGMLFGLTPTDAVTMLMATCVLIAVAVFAGYLPARRASRVDPMVALRYE